MGRGSRLVTYEGEKGGEEEVGILRLMRETNKESRKYAVTGSNMEEGRRLLGDR